MPTGNYIYNNSDAGFAIVEPYYTDVTDNVFKGNKYGIIFSVGATTMTSATT